jgi:uncharacterized phage protein gp47/JayE
MVVIRNVNEIISSLIDYFQLVLPDADTKPGTVIRDLFIEAPASQLALLYDEMSSISNKQSLRLVIGSDLDNLAQNYGLKRIQPSYSAGVALLTFSSIYSNIAINKGSLVTSSNGSTFSVSIGTTVNASSLNFYLSIAAKYADQLNTLGITDQYAVEVAVVATTPGSAGNIGPYSLTTTNINGVSNVTNINAFNGGTDQEADAAFRSRILSTFSGSSVGTALGYFNSALSTIGVTSAYVVQPGDPLMTRDGSVVTTNSDGTLEIVSEGSGGKVDIIAMGSNLVQNTDTFIYQDKSNNNDPTSVKNNYVLGQVLSESNLTINAKRIADISSGIFPYQPVDSIVSVSGSLSGNNFVSKSVDEYGVVSGNYEIIKDTGDYAGSPWGFDTFHWISSQISMFQEAKTKGQYNGQDALVYPDLLEIPQVQQLISITSENSQILSSDNSIIQLLHTPSSNVTRVLNTSTGEQYLITNQNYDNTSPYNNTGRIQISGNTLPSPNDVLQVDYYWVINYDRYSDYDGLKYTSNIRTVNDSIDWGYASNVRNERILFTNSDNFFTGTASLPISTVVSAKIFLEIDGYVSIITTGTLTGRLAVTLSNISDSSLYPATSSIDSVVFKNSNTELYNTAANDGTFVNSRVVNGITIYNTTLVILPTDTLAINGSLVTVILDSADVFYSGQVSGSSGGTQITIPSSSIVTAIFNPTEIILRVSYIANITNMFISPITSIPSSRLGNGFILDNNLGFTNFSNVNTSLREFQIVQQNSSNQFFVDLSTSSNEYLLDSTKLFVVRLSDGAVLWDSTGNIVGDISSNPSSNFELIFSGYNSPAIGDDVLVVYNLFDNSRYQPFSYSNSVIKARVDTLTKDPVTNQLYVNINNITTESTILNFNIKDPNNNISYFSGTDGYILIENNLVYFSSNSVSFLSLLNIINKKIIISNSNNTNNNGTYDILSYDPITNRINISNNYGCLVPDQISIVRILDGKEVWNYSGTIDMVNNQILLPLNISASVGDKVFTTFYNYSNLITYPTMLVSTTSDQINNPGVMSIVGTTISEAKDIIFTCTSNGLRLNLLDALRQVLNLNSIAQIPSTVKLAKLIKLEKVVTVSQSVNEVLEVLTTYDVENAAISNNLLYINNMVSNNVLENISNLNNTSYLPLQNTEFVLPSTLNNLSSSNLPAIGNTLRVSFYYTTDGDSENLQYTQNGTLYTSKKFAYINKIYVSSGFNSSVSTTLSFSSFTQPNPSSNYQAFYNYTAPKENERINITYNYNKLITDTTLNIENTRPVNADVLVKEAQVVELDLTMNVVISNSYLSTQTTVLQNLKNSLISALTAPSLGTVIDSYTLINTAQSIAGISRARILYFNITGNTGTILTFQAQNNQYFVPNNIIINTESY